MKPIFIQNLEEAIRLEYPARKEKSESNKHQKDPNLNTRQDTLRILVGLLGVLLPILIWLFVYCDTRHIKPIPSISHYYYTKAGSVFVITMSLLAVFLMIYKGGEKIDFRLSFAAGLFALLVVFCPTDNLALACCDTEHNYAITFITKEEIYPIFHFICAALFLGTLAIISIFRFTNQRSSDNPIEEYDKLIYRICGIVMILSMLIILLGQLGIIMDKDKFKDYSLTFWFESIAVWAFGYSWLLKAEFFKKFRRFFMVAYK